MLSVPPAAREMITGDTQTPPSLRLAPCSGSGLALRPIAFSAGRLSWATGVRAGVPPEVLPQPRWALRDGRRRLPALEAPAYVLTLGRRPDSVLASLEVLRY